VLPVVAEVVPIQQHATDAHHGAERRRSLVDREPLIVHLVHPEWDVVDGEVMQVAILPAERDLQGLVQAGERQLCRHAQRSPYERVDVAEGDLELEDVAKGRG
jgi:hypothetical protein